MKLKAVERASIKKNDTKRLRREGKIPAILYSHGKEGKLITLDAAEFNTALRKMKPGHLPTTTFTLEIDGKEIKAIIKDIQYQLTTYQVSHVDFEELIAGVPVSVKVPIQCIGVADCAGIKLGGFLRQVIRQLKVECLPQDIPAEFVVDVKELGIKQSKRLSDIPMPKGVKPLANLEEVVVVIGKRAAAA